jgi:hypothetical protein
MILKNRDKTFIMTICDAKQTNPIFIGMTKLNKHLRVRLSAEEFDKLTEALIIMHKNKSSLVREALNDYIERDCIKIEKKNKV